MLERGGIPGPRTPQALTDSIRNEIDKWTRVTRTANARLD